MKDYSDIGLNSRMQKINSLAVRSSGFQPDYIQDVRTDRNIITTPKVQDGAITSEKVGTISFNQAAGGTITLGGAGNGNGIIRVLNSSNVQKVTVSNSGIAVTDGNISIANTAGTTILDGSGLVSQANFPNAYIFSDTDGTTTSSSYTAVAGASLGPFVLSRATNVYVFSFIYGQNPGFPGNGYYARFQGSDSVDGQLFSGPIFQTHALQSIDFSGSSWNTFETVQPFSMAVIDTLSAGTHTLSLNYRTEGGGGSAIVEAFGFGYIVLGN